MRWPCEISIYIWTLLVEDIESSVDSLELKQRVEAISDDLFRHLPSNFCRADGCPMWQCCGDEGPIRGDRGEVA